jgi:anti-sigma-K factor RskA
MTTADIHALTGAYALDAVSGTERMEFERHLAECESCAQEVRELRDTAAQLAIAATATPPPDLRNRVLDQIRTVRQLPPETSVVPLRRRSFGQRLTTVAAAVFFVAAAGLGVVVVQQNKKLDDSQAYVAQMERILSADDAQLLPMENRDGGMMSVAVSRSLDEMLLVSKDLPAPPEGKTYQVWTVAGDAARSMGLMKPNSGNVSLLLRGFSSAGVVAVSVEPDGGSKTPTEGQVVMNTTLPEV